jgi:hypothetical protein
LKPDAIGIKVTEGLIDIDDDNALAQGKPNKIENKTTVSDFVTHEPYDRQSSTQRIKAFIMKRWQRSRHPAQACQQRN